jgi:hypothetical protein
VPLTADTGYFWFFSSENVEAVVKVLDGRGLNGAFWVFYGALSSVQYTMTVTDTQTGLTRRYENPSGQLASVGDTNGFGPLGASEKKVLTTTGSCMPGAQRLCLNGNRFAVTATWKDFQGHTGTGTAVSLTGDTGYFWFFGPGNVEVTVKVLDGCPINQRYWIFASGLTDVRVNLRITDTASGAVKTYTNPQGTSFKPIQDTSAFATCP